MSALIIPGDGEAGQVARDLLSLADSPWHVQTNSDAGMAFVVPDYLADAYNAAMRDVVPADVPTDTPPAPKRRGRPRKEI